MGARRASCRPVFLLAGQHITGRFRHVRFNEAERRRPDNAASALYADADGRSFTYRISDIHTAGPFGGDEKRQTGRQSADGGNHCFMVDAAVLAGRAFDVHIQHNAGVLPVSGYSGFSSLILPAFTLALPTLAQIFRLTRSEVLDVMRERYVMTANAKGLSSRKVLIKHILRNALIPVTVMFFLSLPWLIGGAVVVENVFAWPGMGQLLWKAISKQDFMVVQGIIFVITVLTVICNLIGDIISGILDPRIRLE